MKNTSRQTLNKWFKHLDTQFNLGGIKGVGILAGLKCLSLMSLIASFYFFAISMHSWIVDKQPTDQRTLVAMSICLMLTWGVQGIVVWLTSVLKQRLFAKLEMQILTVFNAQQHALIRQQTTFYWQTLWIKHTQSVVNWCLDYRVQQWVASAIPIVVLGAILYVNPVVGIGLLITLPVVPLFMIIVGKGAASLHQKHFVALNRLGSLFTDRLNALPLLATYRAHDKQTQLLANASEQLNQRTMKVVGVAFLSSSVLDFFSTLAVALVAVFIGFSLLGEITIGPSISLQQGLWMLLTVPLLLSEMKKLGQVYHQKAEAEAAQSVLSPLLTERPEYAASRPKGVCRFTGFEAKHFVVGDLLKGENLVIPVGAKIRLHGQSGSGKTVLLEALSGQRPASQHLNCHYVLLNQTPVILPGSIRENLCLSGHYKDSALYEVLSKVELCEWVQSLPAGLDTKMTDYPILSGGEAQRLSLARALLREADIWLLDEPTAHLPAHQHARLSALILTLTDSKTVVWASHKALSDQAFTHHWHLANNRIEVNNVE